MEVSKYSIYTIILYFCNSLITHLCKTVNNTKTATDSSTHHMWQQEVNATFSHVTSLTNSYPTKSYDEHNEYGKENYKYSHPYSCITLK